MAGKLPDIQVLISYKDLQQLLQASEELDSIKKENQSLQNQMDALRGQFLELMDVFRDLQE